MKKILVTIFVVYMGFFLSGCTTIIRGSTGTTTQFTVRTDPPGADVIIGGKKMRSPAIFDLERRKNYKVVVRKEGYKTTTVNLRSRVEGKQAGTSFLGNTAAFGWWTLGIGTVVGMIVDTVSGSLAELDSDGIFVKLVPGEGEVNLEASDLSGVPRKK